jgi:hypothetical protein
LFFLSTFFRWLSGNNAEFDSVSLVAASKTDSVCPCSPGYTVGSNGMCSSCPSGRFSQSYSQSYCNGCLKGRYASSEGSSTCNLCPFGSDSVSASSNCTTCVSGASGYTTNVDANSRKPLFFTCDSKSFVQFDYLRIGNYDGRSEFSVELFDSAAPSISFSRISKISTSTDCYSLNKYNFSSANEIYASIGCSTVSSPCYLIYDYKFTCVKKYVPIQAPTSPSDNYTPPITDNSNKSSSSIGIAAGAAAGCVILVSAAAAFFFIRRRKLQHNSAQKNTSPEAITQLEIGKAQGDGLKYIVHS